MLGLNFRLVTVPLNALAVGIDTSMNCPNETTLRNFLRGELADGVADQIVVHVDQCSDCEAVLQRLENEPDPVLDPLHPAFQEGIVGSDSQPADSGLREQWQALETALPDGNWLPFPDVAPERPQPLGQYELLEPIGRGGMGAVYRARHTKLGRTVAIKILPARSQRSPAAVARFEREMLAVGALNHPHIVHATDAAETDGVHFLVMEYVDGIDVGSLARALGQLDVPDACEIVRQAALGLQHAHERGLIHRDVKPSNLMLSTDGTVKLLDLGLALLQHDDAPADGLTSTNQIMGTLDYMAPEQADNSHTVDVRADLYSLGATLFRLLTGVTPLDTHNCKTPLQRLAALIHKPRTPITKLRPDLPPELTNLVQSLLASNPADRPPSAKEIIERLTPLSHLHRLSDLWRQFTIARDSSSTTRPETQFPISSMQTDTGVTPRESSSVTSNVAEVVRLQAPAPDQPLKSHDFSYGKRLRWIVTTALLLTGVAAFVLWKRNDGNRTEPDESAVTSIKPTVLFDAQTTEASAITSNSPANSLTSTNPAKPIPQPEPLNIAWTPGPTENVPTGILPAPAAFQKLGRWQIESKAPRGQITDLKWSPDGRWFACASADKVIRVYQVEGSKLNFHAALPFQDVRSWIDLRWCPKSRVLAAGGESGQVLVWQIDEQRLIHMINCDRWWPNSIGWSPDGDDLITSSHQHVACWRVDGTSRWKRWLEKGGSHVACNPVQNVIAVGGDSSIQILDSQTGEDRATFSGHNTPVIALAWSPSGRYLASGGGGWNQSNADTSVRIWSADGKELTKVGVSGYNVTHLAWSRDEKYLAAGADMVKVWKFDADEQNGSAKLAHVADPHPLVVHRAIKGLDWSSDGRLAHADLYGGPRFWSLATSGNQLAFQNAGPLSAIAWAPKDEQFVTYNRGVLRHWTSDGHFQLSLAFDTPPPLTHFREAAWSPDGELVAINHGDWRTLAVCRANATEAEPPSVIRIPRGAAGKLAWSPDSQRLAISSHYETNATFVWDRSTNNVREISDPKNDQRAEWLGWSGDGTTLVRVSHDGRIQRINAATGATTDLFTPDNAAIAPSGGYVIGGWASTELDRVGIRFSHLGTLICADLRAPAHELWRKSELWGNAMAWHPKQPLICAEDKSLFPTLLDGETGKTLGYFGKHSIWSAHWSPEGQRLATLSEAGVNQGPINLFHLWATSSTGAALPEVVGVTLPDGLAASFTPGGSPISLTPDAEKHLTWVIEKPDGRYEYLTRAEFEQRVEMASLPSVSDPLASIPGCVYYWPMNEGRGRVTAALGNHPAEFAGKSGGPEWSTDAAPVAHDNPAALEFDGVDDSLDVGIVNPSTAKQSVLSGQMTVSIWIRTAESRRMSVLGIAKHSTWSRWQLQLNNRTNEDVMEPLRFHLVDENGLRFTRSTKPLSPICDGEWHHIAVRWDSTSSPFCEFWVDGRLSNQLVLEDTSKNGPRFFSDSLPSLELGIYKSLSVDGSINRGDTFKGLLDEFRIYHRVLTEDEIHRLAARRDEAKP